MIPEANFLNTTMANYVICCSGAFEIVGAVNGEIGKDGKNNFMRKGDSSASSGGEKKLCK